MSTMRAAIVEEGAPGRLALREVEAPRQLASEALLRVSAVSLNRGEVHGAQVGQPGLRLGWDVAGVIEQAAADGSGPKVGARAVGLVPHSGWAELVAVPAGSLAVLPDNVSFAQAATLPVAGLTALVALERGGNLLARQVLITGASGGVGHFAVQLAHLSGAGVVGVVHRTEHAAWLRELGAHQVLAGEDAAGAEPYGPYHLIVDSVGGAMLSSALALLDVDGVCVTLGASNAGSATIDLARFFLTGGASLYGLILFHDLPPGPAGRSLSRLAALVARADLRPHIAVQEPWERIGEVAQWLLDRQFVGKAVLHVS